MLKINVHFSCKRCKGSGWETPNSACLECRGKGTVVHMFDSVIKVVEFPEASTDSIAKIMNVRPAKGRVPCGGPSYSG